MEALLGQEFTVKPTGLGESKTNLPKTKQPESGQGLQLGSQDCPLHILCGYVEAFSGLPEGISSYTFSELSVILLLNIYRSDQ